jgi:RNA-binding protein YhbY
MVLINLQIGKNGLTQEFLECLKISFVKNDAVRISVLPSGTRDRKELKKMNDQILTFLGPTYTSKVIGFTIALRKWRKAREISKLAKR